MCYVFVSINDCLYYSICNFYMSNNLHCANLHNTVIIYITVIRRSAV